MYSIKMKEKNLKEVGLMLKHKGIKIDNKKNSCFWKKNVVAILDDEKTWSYDLKDVSES